MGHGAEHSPEGSHQPSTRSRPQQLIATLLDSAETTSAKMNDTRDLHDIRMMKEMDERREDLASLKIILRSIVVSSPSQMTLRSLLRDYQILMRKPLPIYRFGYSDFLRFIQDKCSDCFRLQGGTSNPVVSVIVSRSLQYINLRGENQINSNANKAKGKESSTPDSSVGKATVGEARKYGNVSGRSSSSSGSIICTCIEHLRMNRWLEPRDVNHSLQDNHSYTRASSSQRSSKRAQREDPKDEIQAVTKDSKDGVSCKIDPVMRYQERSTPIASLAQSLGARLHITGNAANDDDEDGDVLLQDVAAALPYPVKTEPATCPGGDSCDAGGSPSPSIDHDEDALPYEPEVYPIDCLQYGESVRYIDISTLKPGDNIEVIVGEVYSPSHFWVIRTGAEYEGAMEELLHEMTEYFEIGKGRKRYLAKDALRIGHYCATFYNCHWHRAIIVDLIRGGELIKVRHFDNGTITIVAPETLRPFLRSWARLPRQALRARLAGVRPAWGGQSWSHAASEYFLRQVDERTLMARIAAINNAEAILEMFLVDTTQREDFEIARDLVQAGFADVRRNSALRITRPDDRYLYPDFSSIEKATTPFFEKIQQYVYNNICHGYVYSVPTTARPHDVAPDSHDTTVMGMFNSPLHWPTATPASPSTATPAPRSTATPASPSTATPAPRPIMRPLARPTATPAPRPIMRPLARPTATPAPRPTATIAPRSTALPARRLTTRPLLTQTATPVPPTFTTPVPSSPNSLTPTPRLSPSPGLSYAPAMDPMLPPYYMPPPPAPYVLNPPSAPYYGMSPLGFVPYRIPGYPYGFSPPLIPHPAMFATHPGVPTIFPTFTTNFGYNFD